MNPERWLRAVAASADRLRAPLGPGAALPQLLERLHLGLTVDFGASAVEMGPSAGPDAEGGWLLRVPGQTPTRVRARWPDPRPEGLELGVTQLLAMAELLLDRAELGEQLAQCREALRARDEHLGLATHQLRTPLGSLQVAVQSLLRARPGPGRPELLEKVLRTVERQTQRMARLVDDLFDASTALGGTLRLCPEPLDLLTVASEALIRLEAEVTTSGSRVEMQTAGPVLGRWDRRRLERVVDHLLATALAQGEGRPVALRIACQDGRAVLTVDDQGGERVASPLGLEVASRIVAAMDGTLEQLRPSHGGSTFTVRLPLSTVTSG